MNKYNVNKCTDLNLTVSRAEHGFVVSDSVNTHHIPRMWAFEGGENLAEFIKEWANNEHTKTLQTP